MDVMMINLIRKVIHTGIKGVHGGHVSEKAENPLRYCNNEGNTTLRDI